MSEEFQNRENYTKLELKIDYQFTDFIASLSGINSIQEYFEGEREYWNSLSQHSGPTKQFLNHFKNCTSLINNFIGQNKNSHPKDFNRNWNSLKNKLQQTSVNNYPILPSVSAEGEYIFQLTKKNPTQANSAYDFICNRNLNFTNAETVTGYLKAYEFLFQHESNIKKRRDAEKKSIGMLRNKFAELISDLQSEFDENVDQYLSWRDEFTDEFETWRDEYVNGFDDWRREKETSFNKFMEASKTELGDLESLYREKLRLDGPVQYWNERAKDHKIAGRIWAGLLSFSVIIVAGILLALLYDPPSVFNTNILEGEPGSVKGLVLFIALISFSGFLIGTLSKLTFSSFHLRRDAEEREQLTHVYLALNEQGQISDNERNLILQSIFSRADTGLLKGEHSPIMPGMSAIIDKLK